MKIIFLDYDGVVNNLVFHDVNGEPSFYAKDNDHNQVNDFQAIAWLNKICREFECKIVVTSTWRFREDYKECLYKAGLNRNVEILGRTPQSTLGNGQRGWDIQEWFSENNYKIEDYIILDDDCDMMHFIDNLIRTNPYRGLGYEEYEKICDRWRER